MSLPPHLHPKARTGAGAVLVVGCGSIGSRHLRNLAHLGIGPLLAFDPQLERSQRVAAEVGATALQSLEHVPDRLRAGFVCTPTNSHLADAEFILSKGGHVFMEKPISDTLRGASDFVFAARDAGRVVAMGFNLRFHPCLRRIKDLLSAGEVGTVLSAQIEFGQYLPDWHPWEDYRKGYSANRRMGGGIVLDAVHELDYGRWLLGEAIAVCGVVRNTGTLDIDSEDHAALVITHKSGAISEIHLDYLQRTYARTCKIVGTTGTVEWDWEERSVRCFRSPSGTWEEFPLQRAYDTNQTYLDCVTDFFNAIETGGPPEVDAEAGVRVLELALAAREAALAGRTVRL